MGYQGLVKSPTYTLVETYRIRDHVIHHLDLYRIRDANELEAFGIREYLDGNSICLLEWPEHAGQQIPEPDLAVIIRVSHQAREINYQSRSVIGMQLLAESGYMTT
jgi:tRNA threonylcarbamoyladenosine biosynthesis protein TsaE